MWRRCSESEAARGCRLVGFQHHAENLQRRLSERPSWSGGHQATSRSWWPRTRTFPMRTSRGIMFAFACHGGLGCSRSQWVSHAPLAMAAEGAAVRRGVRAELRCTRTSRTHARGDAVKRRRLCLDGVTCGPAQRSMRV